MKSKNSPKIIFIQPRLLHYRIEFYIELANRFETRVTVAHSGAAIVSGEKRDKVDEVILNKRQLGPFLHQEKVLDVAMNYDVIILPFDPHYTSFYLPWLLPHKKFLYFGIGFGSRAIGNKMRKLAVKNNRVLLYSPDSLCSVFGQIGPQLLKNISFFNNTIDVLGVAETRGFGGRKKFLFIGSLDKRKGIENIISAYYYFSRIREGYELIIVGDGNMEEGLKELVKSLKIDNQVNFRGAIVDRRLLHEVFNESLATVHYSQAGLSVLQSLGHGVPCIISKEAISGGEKINAIDDYNSIVLDPHVADFSAAMLKLADSSDLWEKLSRNAREFYLKNCSIEGMADRFFDEISGLL